MVPTRPDKKLCRGCDEIKPLDQFYTGGCRNGVQRYAHRCKVCTLLARAERYQRDPERYRAARRERHARLKGTPEYDSATLRSVRKTSLGRFGLTEDDYQILLAKQGGKCKICRQPEKTRGRRLAVDHDHGTGRVRGLLCGNCNNALGRMADDPARLRAAADYLEAA